MNRVLLLEPSHFKQYPVSDKVIEFIINLSKNINGEYECFTAGEPAWHKLGANVKEAVTWKEAMKLANLNWDVTKEQLEYNGKKYCINLELICRLVEPLKKLNRMIGIKNVKEQIFEMIIYYTELSSVSYSCYCYFSCYFFIMVLSCYWLLFFRCNSFFYYSFSFWFIITI